MYLNGINAERARAQDYKTMVGRFSRRKRDRFWEIDFLRGICVLLMVFDHFMYCLWDLMPEINEMLGTSLFADWRNLAIDYWLWGVRTNVRVVVILTFFLLCGISCTLTRGNFKRFIPLALVAAGISAVTSIVNSFIPNTHVRFGVIHMLACGVFAYAVFDEAVSAVADVLGKGEKAQKIVRILRYFPALVGAGLLIFLFAECADLSFENGVIGLIPLFPQVAGNAELNNFHSIFVYVQGYVDDFEQISADYFPLLPYAAVVLLGGGFGRLIYHTSAKYSFAPLDGAWNRGVCTIGRHAAVIYVAHMVVIPVLLGLFALLTKLII